MENKYFFNSQNYNEKSQRIATFGREADGELEIVEIQCSRKDFFSKKEARGIYENWKKTGLKKYRGKEYHPRVFSIVIDKGNTARFQFEQWCKMAYFKKREIAVVLPKWMLINDSKMINYNGK